MTSGLWHPDLSIVCGPPETHPEDPHALTHPVVLVEVLSPGTEADLPRLPRPVTPDV